ncbi:MAG: type II secretion system F family protein [Clostridia bacterium]|nr:type II secretion system F family protein [Clostridia bacterium]MBQ8165092.1 type II secretion system F family protein [Clostridia bacterium]
MIFIVTAGVFVFFAGGLAKSNIAAILILLCMAAAVPDFLIIRRTKKKKESLKYGLADFMDRTAILLDSGMPLWSAIAVTAHNSNPKEPFASEMINAVKSFSFKEGYFYRPEESMEMLADRCSTLMISSFVSLVVQNSRKGSDELACIFKTQSNTYRAEQRNMAKKRAEEASTLMLLPTSIVFAAILALVATPAVMTIISGISL